MRLKSTSPMINGTIDKNEVKHMVFNDTIRVDLNKPLTRSRAVLASGDNEANLFGAELYRDGTAVDITGEAVTGYFIRPDGDTVVLHGEAYDNTATVTLQQACYAYTGSGSLAIRVGTTTVRVIDCHARQTQTGDLIDPGDVVPTLDDLFAQIENMHVATMEAQMAANDANEAAGYAAQTAATMLREAAPYIQQEVSGSGVIAVSDSAEREIRGLTAYGKTAQDGTPTPDAPVPLVNVGADGGSIATASVGKNFFKPFRNNTTLNGITVFPGEDGSFVLNGTATKGFSITQAPSVPIPAGEFVLSTNKNVDATFSLYCKTNGGTTVGSTNNYRAFTTNETITMFGLWIDEGATFDNLVIYPQLETGSKATAYEPYKEGGSIAISTPNGLPGIPVTSGGNYTDENGQQWVCDEFDFVKRVYLQRVITAHLTSDMSWTYSESTQRFFARIPGALMVSAANVASILCTHYPAGTANTDGSISHVNDTFDGVAIRDPARFGGDMDAFKAWLDANDVVVCVPTQTPTKTQLPPEDVTGSIPLTAQYPNTTVTNDAGAGMQMAYIADTKTYIDQRIAAMLNV